MKVVQDAQKKREEEEAQSYQQAKNQAAKLNAIEEAKKAQQLIDGRNEFYASLAELNLTDEQLLEVLNTASTNGLGTATTQAQGFNTANITQQQTAYDMYRQSEYASVPIQNNSPFAGLSAGSGGTSSSTQYSLSPSWNTHVSPLLNNLSNQWNGFIDNLTTPANPVGSLFNFPTNPTLHLLTNTINLTATAIDNTVFGGNISQSIRDFNQTLQSYPLYNATINTFEFAGGAALQYANDMSFGLIAHFVNFENGSDMFQAGMEFGRTLSTIQGVVELVFGAASAAFFLSSIPPTGVITAGCAATTAGLCLPFGGFAIATEAVMATAGVGVMAHGIGVLAHNANNPLQIRAEGGGSGSSYSKLVQELKDSGVKFNEDEIVEIVRGSDGKVVWLEKGNQSSGLEHIINRHSSQFITRGIPEAQIPDAIVTAITEGDKILKVGNGIVYRFEYAGKTQNILIVTGNNGYIVTAYPITP
jgi:hypothetical protein